MNTPVLGQLRGSNSSEGHSPSANNSERQGEGRSLTRRSYRKKQYAISVQWEREHLENKHKCRCCTGTREDCHSLFCCCARRVGSMFFLCEKQDGSPIVVAGPCWPFCLFITIPLIGGLSALVVYYVILGPNAKMPNWFAYIYIPLIGLTLFTLFCVSCRDPGLLERVTDEEAGAGGWYWNEQVGSYRPAEAMYCRECKALIQEYDHLCPWTGTGIGKGNMFCFKAFVILVNILCYTSIGITAYVLLS